MRTVGLILNLLSRAVLGFGVAYVALDLVVDEAAPSARLAGGLLMAWLVYFVTEPISEREAAR